jgi:hypothetical protein
MLVACAGMIITKASRIIRGRLEPANGNDLLADRNARPGDMGKVFAGDVFAGDEFGAIL